MSIFEDAGRLITGGKKREGFEMPTGDQQYSDPTRPGGGVGVEHINGNDASTWTPAPSEVDRYRGMGETAAKRQAYQADFSKAMGDEARGWQAHGYQEAGINNMRQAAMGGAPSQAAILGGQAAGQSLQAQMANGAGARGLGQAAAQQQAAGMVGQQQLGAVGQYAGMRGAEMQHAQSVYGTAGNQMRAGDYSQQGMAQQRADAQAQSEFAQRQLNQGAQMGYEQMGINDQQAQSDADLRNQAVRNKQNADQNAAHDARNARNMQIYQGAAASIGGLAAGSDERMKMKTHMLSDDHTKVVAAQREAFTAGLQHANEAADSGKLGPVPDYMQGGKPPAGGGKQQPPSMARHAAAQTEQRADRTHQDATNQYYGRELAKANLTTLPGMGASALGGGAMLKDQVAEEQQARANANRTRGPMPMRSFVREYPPASMPPEDASMSDERSKQGAHAEQDMGRALEEGYKPFEYEYKPGFREAEGQQPGEKNVGPMAQNMASNSITGSAVQQRPDGLLEISIPKTVKTNSAGIGYLAAKQRKLEEEIARMKGGR